MSSRVSLTQLMGFLFIIFLLSLISLPFASADWPTFHSDASHSGVGAGNSTVNSTILWRFDTGNKVWSSAAVVGDMVFVGSSNGNVYALNASSGSEIWSHATNGEVRSSPSISGGMVYVGSMDNKVYALNALNGSLVWSFTTGNYVDSSPIVVNGVVYVGSLDGKVYALNADNGTVVWSYTTGNAVVSSPAISGGIVYVGSMDHKVYALSATNGSMVWSYTTGGGVYSPPAVVGGMVYVGSWDYSIYALNAFNGSKAWSYATGNYSNSCPAVAYGTVYSASKDGNVYALNASSGSKIWSYKTGSAIVCSPAVVDGVVYFGSYDGYVYALGGFSEASLLQQVWVPEPLNAAAAIGVSAAVLGAASIIFSFVSNPLSGMGEQIGEKTKDMVPDDTKHWLEDVVSSKKKTEIEKKSGPPLRPTKAEVLAYTILIILLAVGFSYVKVSSLDQIWILLPVFLATSILVAIVQKYLAIVFLRRRGVWSEHRIWPLGLVLFLLTTIAFKVPFSSPTRSAHQSSEATERLLGRAAALEILIGLAFAGFFFLLIEGGLTGIGGAGLAMCVIGCLSGTFPVAPMSGKDIFDYNKRRWLGLFIIVVLVFCAWLFLL